ncbi:MAG: sortase [Bacilli bacterium]|nr:sortase [Bacilli bacterium]
MENSRNKIIIFLGILSLGSGILLLSNNYFNEKIDNAYSYMNKLLLEASGEEIIEIQEEVVNTDESTSSLIQEEQIQEVVSPVVDPYSSYYIGTLEIPKINLNKGFTAIDSAYNTVSKNIEVVKGSTYPDKVNGNFILAAHSGSSYLAYFKNLYQLTIGDIAYVNYQNKQYNYKIVNIYEQDKTGKIAIYRNQDKTCLTLVTCTKDKKDKQTVYILELESVKNI